LADAPAWNWGRAANATELKRVAQAQSVFRHLWATMKVPPWPADFHGTVTDLRSLDYLVYESFPRPAAADEQAAKVAGEVVRRLFGFHWVIAHDGQWFVASHGEATEVAICPLARLAELDFARCPQFGRYALWFTRALLDCRWLSDVVRLPPEADDVIDTDYLRGVGAMVAWLEGRHVD
jgi:hypothetical protein